MRPASPCALAVLAAWLVSSSGAGRTETVAAGADARRADAPTRAARAPAFACTLVLGVAVTSEWFGAGFERVVENGRWEAITRPHTSMADWSDAGNPVWSLPPVSPCPSGAGDPDRVLFTGMSWDYTTSGQWVASLTAVVGIIRARFPHVRRIELLTMVRAPRNSSCGNSMSVVATFIDEAILAITRRYPDLVRAAPRFEVARCDLFKKGGPHFTEEGSASVAQMIAAHYAHDAAPN